MSRPGGGTAVTSFDLLGIPILDVSAPEVTIHWADPTVPHVAELFGSGTMPIPAKGLLIGQGDNVVIVSVAVVVPAGVAEHRVVRFDAPSVIVELA